jgi:Bacteriophage holin family
MDGKFYIPAMILQNLAIKIHGVFTSCVGYAFCFMSFMMAVFGEKSMLFHYVLVCIAIDQFWGMASAKKRNRFILSTSIVKLTVKLAIYLTIFVMTMMGETILSKDYFVLTRLVTTLLCSAELLSSCAHILVIAPDTKVVKLLSKFFVGEIAKKMQMKTSELDKLLNNEHDE